MNKKVRIISSSPRRGGNSETLAAAFAEGAQAAGHQVETVYLREKQIGYCKGCFACHELGHCVLRDDAAAIIAKMHDADVLVFATPVYYYCVSGQQDPAGSRQPAVRQRLRLYESLSAGDGGGGRAGDLRWDRKGRAGLGGLLPPLHTGRHGVRRRRERRGRDRRASRAGAGLSDGQRSLIRQHLKHFPQPRKYSKSPSRFDATAWGLFRSETAASLNT